MSMSLKEAVQNLKAANIALDLASVHGDLENLRKRLQERELAVKELATVTNNLAIGQVVLEHLKVKPLI